MRITSLEQITGTQVVRASEDKGKTWFFARIAFSPNSRLDFTYLNRAVSSSGLHHASKVTENDLKSANYLIETAEPDEYTGLQFSYHYP